MRMNLRCPLYRISGLDFFLKIKQLVESLLDGQNGGRRRCIRDGRPLTGREAVAKIWSVEQRFGYAPPTSSDAYPMVIDSEGFE
jgi:hypothetical protein